MKSSKLFVTVVSVFMVFTFYSSSSAYTAHTDVGFLVVAPDRGFLGNEETRASFNEFADGYMAELVFSTKSETKENIKVAVKRLESRNVKGIWTLPFFLSPSSAKYLKAAHALQNYRGKVPIRMTETMNESYLTEEILLERASKLSQSPSNEIMVVIASGAIDGKSEEAIMDDLDKITERVRRRLGFKEMEVVVLYDREANDELRKDAMARVMDKIAVSTSKAERVLVIPFNFGMRFTNMMASWNMVKRRISKYKGTVFSGEGVVPHPNVARWLKKKANQRLPLTDEEIGVVFMPHGSDYNWNETMREAIKPLFDKYKIEYAFSMADPMIIGQAVKKLEKRGCRAIVVLRVFSLESSFREKTEYMLGLIDRAGRPVKRISSESVFVTLGGTGDHPLFAETLLHRAKELSKAPEKETVILLAHGTDDDDRNRQWMDILNSLADRMRANGGSKFKDIQHYTWREDWPDKREEAVEVIRSMVSDAASDGGAAIVVPGRTTGRGPGDKYLKGLEYRYATGFAPHKNFTKWVEEKIEEGIDSLKKEIEKNDPMFAVAPTGDAQLGVKEE